MFPIYQRGCSLLSAFILLLPCPHCVKFSDNRGKNPKKVAKVNKFLVRFGVFSVFWKTKRAKSKHIFESECKVGAGCGSACLPFACPLVQAFEGAGPARSWLWSFGRVFRPFSGLSRFACLGLVKNMALFRVLRALNWVYTMVVWVCIGCGLCVACGAFVCVSG